MEQVARWWKKWLLGNQSSAQDKKNAAVVLSHMRSNVLIPYLLELLAAVPDYARLFIEAFPQIGTREALDAFLTWVEGADKSLYPWIRTALGLWQRGSSELMDAETKETIQRLLEKTQPEPPKPQPVPQPIRFVPTAALPWLQGHPVSAEARTLGAALADLARQGFSVLALLEQADYDAPLPEEAGALPFGELLDRLAAEKGWSTAFFSEPQALVLRSAAALQQVWATQEKELAPRLAYWREALPVVQSVSAEQLGQKEWGFIPDRALTAVQREWLERTHPDLWPRVPATVPAENVRREVNVRMVPIVRIRDHPLPEFNQSLIDPWTITWKAVADETERAPLKVHLAFARVPEAATRPAWPAKRLRQEAQFIDLRQLVTWMDEQIGGLRQLTLDDRVPAIQLYAAFQEMDFWAAVSLLTSAAQLDVRLFEDPLQAYLTFFDQRGDQAEKFDRVLPLLDAELLQEMGRTVAAHPRFHVAQVGEWEVPSYDLRFVDLPPDLQECLKEKATRNAGFASASDEPAYWQGVRVEFRIGIVVQAQVSWERQGTGEQHILTLP